MKVKGFSAAAVEAGIRYPDRLDLGLIYSECPAVTAGVFTTNRVKAAPILLCMERLRQGQSQALLVNSGNANACTGSRGMEIAIETSSIAAKQLKIDEELIQVASTGVIGEPLSCEPFARVMPELVDSLSEDGFADLAKSIMTTDKASKMAMEKIVIDGVEVSVLGVCKGSGMIMPDMATMLCFVVTDAKIVFPVLKNVLKTGVSKSFNRITVDGDTSTNDMVLIMANGAAENKWIDEDNPDGIEVFSKAVYTVLQELAAMVVVDGEGATKVVTIRVNGAREEAEAVDAARTIANSPLVKTAFFGEDPNWGRVMAALGRSRCRFQEDRVAIFFDDILMVDKGLGMGIDAEKMSAKVMKQDKFMVSIQLNEGTESAEIMTCDLSKEYISINADYRS
jgi:glutamate N-acetyltransferase/amino-acid N-acetyltransferase